MFLWVAIAVTVVTISIDVQATGQNATFGYGMSLIHFKVIAEQWL